jgi:hypothetical protein
MQEFLQNTLFWVEKYPTPTRNFFLCGIRNFRLEVNRERCGSLCWNFGFWGCSKRWIRFEAIQRDREQNWTLSQKIVSKTPTLLVSGMTKSVEMRAFFIANSRKVLDGLKCPNLHPLRNDHKLVPRPKWSEFHDPSIHQHTNTGELTTASFCFNQHPPQVHQSDTALTHRYLKHTQQVDPHCCISTSVPQCNNLSDINTTQHQHTTRQHMHSHQTHRHSNTMSIRHLTNTHRDTFRHRFNHTRHIDTHWDSHQRTDTSTNTSTRHQSSPTDTSTQHPRTRSRIIINTPTHLLPNSFHPVALSVVSISAISVMSWVCGARCVRGDVVPVGTDFVSCVRGGWEADKGQTQKISNSWRNCLNFEVLEHLLDIDFLVFRTKPVQSKNKSFPFRTWADFPVPSVKLSSMLCTVSPWREECVVVVAELTASFAFVSLFLSHLSVKTLCSLLRPIAISMANTPSYSISNVQILFLMLNVPLILMTTMRLVITVSYSRSVFPGLVQHTRSPHSMTYLHVA